MEIFFSYAFRGFFSRGSFRLCGGGFIDVDQIIIPGAEAHFDRVFQGVFPVQFVETVEEAFVAFCLVDQVQTGLVQSHRIV